MSSCLSLLYPSSGSAGVAEMCAQNLPSPALGSTVREVSVEGIRDEPPGEPVRQGDPALARSASRSACGDRVPPVRAVPFRRRASGWGSAYGDQAHSTFWWSAARYCVAPSSAPGEACRHGASSTSGYHSGLQ